MSFLLKSSTRAFRPAASIARTQVRFGTSDYGSGAGNPAGEKPEKQGKNPSEHLEHPGPAPPKVAKGKSSSSPNNDDDSSSAPSSNSGSTSGKDSSSGTHSGNTSAEETIKKSKDEASDKPQPKLAAKGAPPEEQQSEEVRRHNKEMKERTGSGVGRTEK